MREIMTYRPYTESEIAAIRARYATEGARRLAAEMGRDPRNVSARARALGLQICPQRANHHRRHRWTDDEDLYLRQEWPKVYRRESGKTTAHMAHHLGVSVTQLRSRVARLGLRRSRIKDTMWSEAEDNLLHELYHLCVEVVQKKMAKKGFRRTIAAIQVRRNRLGLLVSESTNTYTGHGLARLLGCSPPSISRWIRLGLLRATPRGESVIDCTGAVGDRWIITPQAARRFIVEHVARIDLSRADRFWLVDLLAGGADARPRSVIHYDTCGRGDGGGLDEMRIAA